MLEMKEPWRKLKVLLKKCFVEFVWHTQNWKCIILILAAKGRTLTK
jgi:hypothetical protein